MIRPSACDTGIRPCPTPKLHLPQTDNRLQLTPELLYPVVLTPNRQYLAAAKRGAEDYHASQLTPAAEEQQDARPERRILRAHPPVWTIAAPFSPDSSTPALCVGSLPPPAIHAKDVVVLRVHLNLREQKRLEVLPSSCEPCHEPKVMG